ncbi:hypothetical protein DDZ13_01120 [Coraliomargarita sinensis]|uniref:Uncharacterized protein n=1 Tax=Coraliomargarita sinensis TaxID=2174842 RepID=A0A317ZQ09_9BACT|nr:hypothetical protein [Coraliomargarita sinensis]PXA05501.1 hypothetical protein DDZ13_01120 [Coraliomargarita sinensis]
MMNRRTKSCRTAVRYLSIIAGGSLLALTSASAVDYYWDSNDGTSGFGSADGTWLTPTPSTATSGFSTDSTGSTAISGNPDVSTTTADNIFFGTSTNVDLDPDPDPLVDGFDGVITIDGTVSANSIYFASSVPNWVAGTNPVLNFSAEGSYYHGTNGTHRLPTVELTGATISMTWLNEYADNLIIEDVTNHAAMNIHAGKGNLVIDGLPNDGETVTEIGTPFDDGSGSGTPLVVSGGSLRLLPDFPYASVSEFNAAHPLTFTTDENAGFDPRNFAFTVDSDLALGTGAFLAIGSGSSALIIDAAQTHTGGTRIMGGNLTVSDNSQLGNITGELLFGSGTTEYGEGTLVITGNTFTDFGARPFAVTPDKGARFNIVEADHTFTLDKVLPADMGQPFRKYGAGTMVLDATNLHTTNTDIYEGTLLVNGDQTAATGLTDVRSGSLLGGTGIIGGNVTVENTSGLSFDISTAPGSHDKLDVVGTLTFENASGCVLNITASSEDATTGTYTLLTAAGGFANANIPGTVNLPSGWSADAPSIVGNDLVINITSLGGGTDYATWAGDFVGFTDTTEDLDFDNGGLESAVEYVLGGDPTDATDDAGKAPNSTVDATNLIFTFVRDQASIHPNTAVTVDVGTDLSTWPDAYSVGADTAESDEGVSVSKDDPEVGFDTVTVTVPKSPDTKKFAKLSVAITP